MRREQKFKVGLGLNADDSVTPILKKKKLVLLGKFQPHFDLTELFIFVSLGERIWERR